MFFRSLYYDVQCTFKIMNSKITKTYSLEGLRLDYEDNQDFIKAELLKDIFKDDLFYLTNAYDIPMSKIEVVKCEVNQIRNINESIKFSVKQGYLVAHSIDNAIFQEKIEINQYLIESVLGIEIVKPNKLLQYKIDITDGKYNTIDFFENVYFYTYKTKHLKLEIKSFYNDICVSTLTKNISINDLAEHQDVVKFKPEKSNTHTSDLPLFQSGLAYDSTLVSLTDKANTNVFDMKAIIKSVHEEPIIVYPKVTLNYKTKVTYSYDIEKVFGECTYNAKVIQAGSIKAKIVKYATKPYRVTYDIVCKVDYPDGGWHTKTTTLSREETFDMKSYVYMDNQNMQLKFNDDKIAITPDSQAVYSLMSQRAKEEHNISGSLTLHSFKITNIKTYNGETVISQGKQSHITPTMASSNDDLNTSSPVIYYVQPFLIFSGNRFITKQVGGESSSVITPEDLSFDIYDQEGTLYDGTDYSYKAFIVEKDDFVNAEGSGDNISAHSTKVYTISESYEFDDENTGITILLYEKLSLKPPDEKTEFEMSVTLTCTGRGVTHMGEILQNGQSKNISKTDHCYNMLFGIVGTIHIITITETLYLPKKGEYAAGMNGNEATYLLPERGKDDFNSIEEPFLVPSYAYNIIYDADIYNIQPKEAEGTVTKTIIPSKDTNAYSMHLQLTSDYMAPIIVDIQKYVETQFLGTFNLMDNYIKTYTFNIKKPLPTHNRYIITIDSTNPNILFDHKKNIVIEHDSYDLDVLCKATKHPARKWHVMLKPSYCYVGEDEYFIYDHYYRGTVTGTDNIYLDKIIQTTNPICIMNEGRTLQRVVSTESDGITIKETLNGQNNTFYTAYNHIVITKVENEEGEDVPYIPKKHYFIANENVCTVYYKVIDSFDYKVTQKNTKFTIHSIHKGNVEIYYYENNRLLNTEVSLNPIHETISAGYIFISDKVENIYKHSVSISNYDNCYNILISLIDKYGNPVSARDATINVNKNAGDEILHSHGIDYNGVVQIILKSSTSERNEVITITDSNGEYSVDLAGAL